MLRNDNSRSVHGVALDGGKRFIHATERKGRHLRLDPDLACNTQEIARVGTGHVGNAADLPLAPKQPIVIKLRYTVQMDGVNGHDSSFAKSRECSDHHLSAWRKGNGT